MDYQLPTLTAISEGALVDARFKVAMQLLLAPNFVNDCRLDEIEPVAYALDMAMKLFELGVAKQLIEPLPACSDITSSERRHVERNAQAQVLGQIHAQRVAQDEQSRVMPVAGGRVLNG